VGAQKIEIPTEALLDGGEDHSVCRDERPFAYMNLSGVLKNWLSVIPKLNWRMTIGKSWLAD